MAQTIQSFERQWSIAGVTLPAVLACSLTVLWMAPTDTGARGFGIGAIQAIAWLDLAWEAVAIGLAVCLRARTTVLFRITLALNSVVVVILVSQYLAVK